MTTDSERLLAADEPSPVRVLRESGTSDLVLTADHAGRSIPRRLGRLGVPESELESPHRLGHRHRRRLREHLSAALDAIAVLQTYSRLVIDCNRDPSMPRSMPEISEATQIPGNVGLSEAERTLRVREIFAPITPGSRRCWMQRAAAGRRTVLVAMHSFTPVFKGESARCRWACYSIATRGWRRHCSGCCARRATSCVGENAPYAITDTSDYAYRCMARNAACRMWRSRSGRT